VRVLDVSTPKSYTQAHTTHHTHTHTHTHANTMHIHTCTHTHTHMHKHTHTHTYAHMNTYTLPYAHTHTTHTHTHMHTQAHSHTHTCTHTYAHMNTYTHHMHTHTTQHTHTHTHTHTANLEAPYFTVVPPRCIRTTVGYSIVLHCSAAGSPSPTITWRKEGDTRPLNTTQVMAWVSYLLQPLVGLSSTTDLFWLLMTNLLMVGMLYTTVDNQPRTSLKQN